MHPGLETIIIAKYRCKNSFKSIGSTLKKALLSLISANQSVYVDGRFVSEGGRLISKLLEISDTLKLDELLATIDIQKAFDSIDMYL